MKYMYWLGLMMFLFSCSGKKCPETTLIEGKGDKVTVSMIECTSLNEIFELELKLDLVHDTLSGEKGVRINTENIILDSKHKFDFEIIALQLSSDSFTFSIAISEGDRLNILGTDVQDKTSMGYSTKSRTTQGVLVTFIFNGTMEEYGSGTFLSRIAPDVLNERALEKFNKHYAESGKECNISLSIN